MVMVVVLVGGMVGVGLGWAVAGRLGGQQAAESNMCSMPWGQPINPIPESKHHHENVDSFYPGLAAGPVSERAH
jgi:hypothetical protein